MIFFLPSIFAHVVHLNVDNVLKSKGRHRKSAGKKIADYWSMDVNVTDASVHVWHVTQQTNFGAGADQDHFI